MSMKIRKASAWLLCALLGAAFAQAETEAPEFVAAEPMGGKPAPFSEAVKAPPFLFVSGMVGMKPDSSGLVEGGIGPETRATLERIRSVIEANGSSMERVVKCTVFLADIKEWGAMNEVYVGFFAA